MQQRERRLVAFIDALYAGHVCDSTVICDAFFVCGAPALIAKINCIYNIA